jgi:hypothetical protein
MPRILSLSIGLLVVTMGLAGASMAAASGKAALVIGNAAYRNVPPLANPVNDADDMAASLGRIGYSVTLVRDGDLGAMNEGLRTFLHDADHADAALIFYSGHGLQVNGRNYLVPISAKVADELDLDTQAISLDKILDFVDGSGAKVKIVILDSCRDNPLARSLVRGGGTRGLARIDLDAASARGTLIAFSTSPGAVAQDGSGRNSPFTKALLAHVETPNLDIREMIGQVRADVDAATSGAQTPWVNEAIIGSFAMAGQVPETGRVSIVTAGVPAPLLAPEAPSQPAALPIPEAPRSNAQRDFIFADSDRRRLSYEEVAPLSPAELRIARNEIFARRGRFMRDPQLSAYFSQFSWYAPNTWNPSLNAIEKANVALLQRVEAGK